MECILQPQQDCDIKHVSVIFKFPPEEFQNLWSKRSSNRTNKIGKFALFAKDTKIRKVLFCNPAKIKNYQY